MKKRSYSLIAAFIVLNASGDSNPVVCGTGSIPAIANGVFPTASLDANHTILKNEPGCATTEGNTNNYRFITNDGQVFAGTREQIHPENQAPPNLTSRAKPTCTVSNPTEDPSPNDPVPNREPQNQVAHVASVPTPVLDKNLVAPAIAVANRSPASQTEDAPKAPATAQQIEALRQEDLRQTEFIDRAQKSMTETFQSLSQDTTVIAKSVENEFKNQPIEKIEEAFHRTVNTGREHSELLRDAVKSDLPLVSRNFIAGALDDAAAKAEWGLSVIDKERKEQGQFLANTPLRDLASTHTNPLARTKGLGEVFRSDGAAAEVQTRDALVDRMAMYLGLPAEKQRALTSELKMLELPEVTLKNGETRKLAVLHNGYIFGASKTGIDCSSFVSSILPISARKMRYTTLDFRNIWLYRRTGSFPKPPAYEKSREKLIKSVSDGFIPIDIYAGEKLQKGDLIVYRLLWEQSGHVFVVKSYDPQKLEARVLEAAQSAGTLRERNFPLSVYPMDAENRIIRPGLFGLRLKPESTRACKQPESVATRIPAGNQEGGP